MGLIWAIKLKYVSYVGIIVFVISFIICSIGYDVLPSCIFFTGKLDNKWMNSCK